MPVPTRLVRLLAVSTFALSLAGCGSNPTDRTVSGAGIGAGVGVGAALLGAPLLPAVLVGGALGAATGAVTSDKQIDLGR